MIYFLISVLLFPIVWRVAFVRAWDGDDVMTRGETALITGLTSSVIALLWPAAILVIPIYFWVVRPTAGEKKKKLERELKEREFRLRREAEKLGLPYDV